MTETRQDLLFLNDADNIAVLKRAAKAGSVQQVGAQVVTLDETLGMGHKIAITPISRGEDVMKYGCAIGIATRDIGPGEHVHLHNVASRYTVVPDVEAEE